MSKERLNEVKERLKHIDHRDVRWLENEVERLQTIESLNDISPYLLEQSQQKSERLEKALSHIHTITQGDFYQQALIQVDSEYAYALLQIESDAKQALKMEGKE
jgi:hypothetical protein